MFCPNCGQSYQGNFCPKCGSPAPRAESAPTVSMPTPSRPVSAKNRLAALLLAIFLGCLGVHRFYTGKIGTGILYLFTGGLFGIGWLVDVILIACGSFCDKAGLPVLEWGV